MNKLNRLLFVSIILSMCLGKASAQTTENILDFGTVKETWGYQGSNLVYMGTYASSARRWYEDPNRGSEYASVEPPFNLPLEVLDLGATKYSAIVEFTTPNTVSGKDWFIALNPASVYLGVGGGPNFSGAFGPGDGYVTLEDGTSIPTSLTAFGITNDYTLWNQPVGTSYKKFADAPANYGYGWSGQMSRATVFLKIPDMYVDGDPLSLRLDLASGGILFNLPSLIALDNPANRDVLLASEIFPASPVPEPKHSTLLLIGLLSILVLRYRGRAIPVSGLSTLKQGSAS